MRYFIIAISSVVLFSCGPIIRGYTWNQYAEMSKSIKLGMTQDEFITTFPLAMKRGAANENDGLMESFEVPIKNWRAGWYNDEPYFFYFKKGILVKYGSLQDFPAKPGQIIETRQR